MSQVNIAPPASWMLVAGVHDDPERAAHPPLAKRPLLLAVARRGIPNVIESTVVPALLFILLVSTTNAVIAMGAVLAWGYVAVLRRVVRRAPVPAILMLATLGLTVRTLVGLLSGSTFAYFLQPIATTVVLAAVFLGSVVVGRPVIGRLAHDFCPISPDLARRPAVVRLFAGLTILWAGVHLLTAAMTFGMLVSLSLPMFVALKTVASFGVTAVAIAVTVWWALRTVRTEHLVFAVA